MESISFGKCCVCEKEGKTVRNIMTMHLRAPGPPGHGWGCILCGLPSDGAVAVLCDECVAAKKPVRFVCEGYAAGNLRVPIEGLEEFDHDPQKHEEAYEAHQRLLRNLR